MRLDVLVDDELESGEPHPVRRQGRQAEGELRVAEIDHDPGGGALHGGEIRPPHLERHPPGIDEAGIALGAGDGHQGTVPDGRRGALGPDHGRDAELAGHDRGMAGAPAAVGDDRGRPLHHRLPVGRGRVGDQHLAVAEALQLARVGDEAGTAGGGLGADGTAAGQHLALAGDQILLDDAHRLLRGHRLRPGLDDVELMVEAVQGPLDVHGRGPAGVPGVVILDADGIVGELQHLLVGEAEAAPLLLARRPVDHRLAGAPLGIDHLDLLGAQGTAQHAAEALPVGGLVDVELVHVDRTLDHVLADAPGTGDEHRVLEAGLGVDREHHARACEVRADHLLHADREGDLEVVEALVDPVGDRPVGEQRGLAAAHGIQQQCRPAHVQVALVLAGEARRRQVLGRGRAADRHRQSPRRTPPAAPGTPPAPRLPPPAAGQRRRRSRGSGLRHGQAPAHRPCRARPVLRAAWARRPPAASASRKAWAVTAKPFGTRTPSGTSSRTISPRLAFLPPTSGTSPIESSLNQRT